MSAVQIVIQALLGEPGVAAFVGDRITIAPVPRQMDMPALSVYLVSENDGYHMQGANEFPESRVTVECLAEDPGVADRLGKAVIVALRNFRGAIGSYRDIAIFKDGSDQQDNDAQASVMRRIIDFRVRWREA